MTEEKCICVYKETNIGLVRIPNPQCKNEICYRYMHFHFDFTDEQMRKRDKYINRNFRNCGEYKRTKKEAKQSYKQALSEAKKRERSYI